MNYIAVGQRLKYVNPEDYLANTVETFALSKLVLHLPGTFLCLLQTAHGTGVLAIAKVDPSHQGVCSLQILQEVIFPALQPKEAFKIGLTDTIEDVRSN